MTEHKLEFVSSFFLCRRSETTQWLEQLLLRSFVFSLKARKHHSKASMRWLSS